MNIGFINTKEWVTFFLIIHTHVESTKCGFTDYSSETTAEYRDVFKHCSGAMSWRLTPGRIMLSIYSKLVDDNHKGITLITPNGIGRISRGGCSTGTGVLLSRNSRPPRYQLKTQNIPVKYTNSLEKLCRNQKMRLHEFSSTKKWIQARISMHRVCALTAIPSFLSV